MDLGQNKKTMKHAKIDKRKARSEVRSNLRPGKTRQEAFDILIEEYKYAKEVAAVVKFIPFAAAKIKIHV